ncbi:MAG: hypothetical protein ACLQVJ_06190, partial [Syntrophobacteraceae bacterium]
MRIPRPARFLFGREAFFLQARKKTKIPSDLFEVRGDFYIGDEAAASYSPTQFARAVPSAQRSLT